METTPVTARIGASIRSRRIGLGLSQAELSEQLGISRAKISAMENGRFGSSKLLEMVTLNAAIGNCDMHARNLALMLNDGKISLTPAYDVVPTAVWPDHDRELSLRIGGEVFLDELQGEHLLG